MLSHVQLFATHGLYSAPGSSVHGDSPGKNTGVGCHVLLQRIFPNQGSNPSLLHCRQILYCLNHWTTREVSAGTYKSILFVDFLGASQGALVVKNPPANARDKTDTGSIPGSGRSHGEGNGHPFQYSCLENPMDRGAWRATVHGVAKS